MDTVTPSPNIDNSHKTNNSDIAVVVGAVAVVAMVMFIVCDAVVILLLIQKIH